LNLHLDCDIRTRRGAVLHLNIKGRNVDHVRIKAPEYLSEEVKWRNYTSDPLFVKMGETVMLYIDASSNTQSWTFIDNLKLIESE